MSLDKMIPAAPKSNIIGWLTLISVLLIIVFVYDNYFGKGDFFGLSKKQKVQEDIQPAPAETPKK